MEISREDVIGSELQYFSEKERFLKIPIESYMALRDFEPVPPQIALINAIQNPKYRFITACLSRRTGKSEISNMIGHLVTLVPGCQILIIAPNYSLSSISWDLQRKYINLFDIEVDRSNAKDKIIELKNGSIIRMGSVSQADSVVGRSYDFIIFDEAALNNDGADVFNIQLRPTLDKPNSKAVFISTPRGKNWFYNFWMRGYDYDVERAEQRDFPAWCSIRSTWEDNPRANKKDIEDARASISDAEFKQEYEADFIALEGQIYNLKDEHIIQVDKDKIDVWDVVAGMDIGFRDPTAIIVALTDGKNYYIIDEAQFIPKATSEIADRVTGKINRHNIDFIYIDSAAKQTRLDLAHEYDISTINAKKDVLMGIGYIQSLVEHDRLFIDESCENVIAMFQNTRWDDKEGLLNERQLRDPHIHISDAVRYALYTHSYNLDPIGDII
jgi:phage terminase large subunit